MTYFNHTNYQLIQNWANLDWKLTFGSKSLSHCGRMKNMIPSIAPGSVTARTSNIKSMTYGNNAKNSKSSQINKLLFQIL